MRKQLQSASLAAVAAQAAMMHEVKEMPPVSYVKEEKSAVRKNPPVLLPSMIIKVKPQANKAKTDPTSSGFVNMAGHRMAITLLCQQNLMLWIFSCLFSLGLWFSYNSPSLIDEGKLMDALTLSDCFLRNGASDRLLQLPIEHGEETYSISGLFQSYEGQSIWSNNWQYYLRLRDKQLAAKLALRYLHRWELDSALDVLTMCNCHLLQNDPLRNEVLQRRQALQRYKLILCADNHYSCWQEVEADCTEDPEGLALRLAGKGAVSAELRILS